ncbi:hypothetical protein BDR26DRAFT_834489 [Obelidium mucronatum]|nr:hypothetical protein BDR26DRAFT_834489 [Obelidium mucronatum]
MDNNRLPPPPPPGRGIPEELKAQIVLSMSQEYSLDEYFEEFQASLQSNNTATAALPAMPVKKTPFQLKKEAEEAKRKQNEMEAAAALQEFERSFDTAHQEAPSRRGFVAKTWVKGGAIQKEFSELVEAEGKNEADDGDGLYRPHLKFEQQFQQQPRSPPLPAPVQHQQQRVIPQPGSKKRQLDSFLREIKQQQESAPPCQRQRFSEVSQHHGSHDTGDGRSANLFVGNLHPAVTERQLLELFGQYGPIGSIKIMWPRTQEEIDRGRNTGFVGFMKREDADKALKALDLFSLEGRELRIGWGKAVPIPNQPIFVLPKTGSNNHMPETPTVTTGLPFNAQIPPPPVLNTTSARRKAKLQSQVPRRPEVRVVIPTSKETLMRINRTIQFVLLHGPSFEAALMEREKVNPEFAFLFDHTIPEHAYYRWKLFSLLQGDSKTSWPVKPFQMFDEGATWIPPAIPFDEHGLENNTDTDTDSSDSDSDDDESSYNRRRKSRRRQSANGKPNQQQQSRKQYLPHHKLRLQTRLRNLVTNSRSQIATLMIFCLSHASTDPSAIVQTISESLVHPATPLIPNKLARLHLVSDILHNSASPSVQQGWKYRGLFEKSLDAVFRHFGECWKGVEARLRAEQWKRGVLGVVGVWEQWGVFDQRFTEGLRKSFQDGCDGVSPIKQALEEEKVKAIQDEMDEDIDGVPMESSGGVSMAAEKTPVETEKPRIAASGFKPIDEKPAASKFSPIGAIASATSHVQISTRHGPEICAFAGICSTPSAC